MYPEIDTLPDQTQLYSGKRLLSFQGYSYPPLVDDAFQWPLPDTGSCFGQEKGTSNCGAPTRCYIRVEGEDEGRRGDRFRMGYDRARECRRSTEVNGRGFRNMDMDHYTTARFKGMKEGKEDGRGLPEVKAGRAMSGNPEVMPKSEMEPDNPDVRDKVIDKSGRRTEDGSRVRRPEYSDVGGSVKTMENDGKPNNVNNQSKTFYSNSGGPECSGEDRNVKPEEDGDERMITGSHPVVVRMSSGVEPKHQDDRKFRQSGEGMATEVDIGGGRIAASAKGVRAGGRETSGKRRAKPEAPNFCRSPSQRSSQHGRDERGWQRAGGATEVAIQKRKRMKKFRNPNADKSYRETRGGRRDRGGVVSLAKPATRLSHRQAGADGSNGVEVRGKEFPCWNLAQTETVADGSGNAETKAVSREATTCVFAFKIHISEPEDQGKPRPENGTGRIGWRLRRTKSRSNKKLVMNGERKEISPTSSNPNPLCRRAELTPDSREKSYWRQDRKWMVIFPSTNIGAGKPGSSSGNGNGRKGEGKPDGMPEQLPEEGTEGTEDVGKDV
ncbi:hypothetical protein K438DRAFT_1789014 [Mycena galopus ATCC 62051]|nr:hypothetical protein K438DRAFT_1789014 [Mycena galopus ATCC 62051]